MILEQNILVEKPEQMDGVKIQDFTYSKYIVSLLQKKK